MSAPLTTLLTPWHEAVGARLVDFAGWLMPVQYRGILEEHRAVRECCGVFDISHMGEIFVSGPGAAAWLEGLLTNRLSLLAPGEGQYTLLLNERGGVIDDLLVYQLSPEEFFLVVNAAKIAEDVAWLKSHLPADGVTLCDRSCDFGALAIQGPDAPVLYEKLFGRPLPERNSVHPFLESFGRGLVGVTGYTGEAGFELFLETDSPERMGELMDRIVAAGAEPCGLGARDTLRLEMGYPLNGSDLSPKRTPLEAGLGFFVDLEKGPFPGREILVAQKEKGVPSKLVGLVVEGKAPPPRAHYPVWIQGECVGETTSGALSPSLGQGIALAYIPTALACLESLAEIEIRGRRFPARLVRKTFYKKA